MSNLGRRLAAELVDALEFTAREVSRGLSEGTKRVAAEVEKAAAAYAEAEARLARDAGGLRGDGDGGGAGHPPGGGRPPAPDRPHVDLSTVPAWSRSRALPTDPRAAELVPSSYRPHGGLTEQEFFDAHWNEAENRWWNPGERPGDPDRDGFAGGLSRPNQLAPGSVIDRFGGTNGEYASPAGTGFEERALPPSALGRPLVRLRVTQPLPETVLEGPVAGAYEQPGGGVQYKFPQPIQSYIGDFLEEIE